MGMEEPQIRIYEEVLALHPDLSEKETKQLYSTSSKVIKEQGGKIHRLDAWGSRPLSNPKAKKLARASYFHMVFSAKPQTIKELRRRLRMNDRVIYFHHERIPKNQTAGTYIEDFLYGFNQTSKKEMERVSKLQKKGRF